MGGTRVDKSNRAIRDEHLPVVNTLAEVSSTCDDVE